MNAITIIASEQFDAWVEQGRTLAGQKRNVDWALADWVSAGQAQGFIDQAGFDFLSDNLGIAPKRLKDITKAADFPAHLRDSALSIEHHASVASLPTQDALQLLHTAKTEHWTPERTRVEAQSKRLTDVAGRNPRDEDALLESFLRHWNRLPRHLRLDAAERISEANGEEIEP